MIWYFDYARHLLVVHPVAAASPDLVVFISLLCFFWLFYCLCVTFNTCMNYLDHCVLCLHLKVWTVHMKAALIDMYSIQLAVLFMIWCLDVKYVFVIHAAAFFFLFKCERPDLSLLYNIITALWKTTENHPKNAHFVTFKVRERLFGSIFFYDIMFMFFKDVKYEPVFKCECLICREWRFTSMFFWLF